MGMFADAVNDGPPGLETRGSKCKVAQWLKGQDDETRAEVLALIANEDWRFSELETLFQGGGFNVTADTISRHRRHLCRTCG